MASQKHPPPVHLRPKLDRRKALDKKLAKTEVYVAAQGLADPQNKLGPEAATLAAARANVIALLGNRVDLKAKTDINEAALVIAVDAHDTAQKDYANAAARFAGSDVSLLSTLGVETAKPTAKIAINEVDAPTDVVIMEGANPGDAPVKCRRVAHAGSYMFQYKLEPSRPEDPWLPEGGIQTKYARTILTDLLPGQPIRVRICAIGGVTGPWSEEVVGRAR